jgi:hypothetical protein
MKYEAYFLIFWQAPEENIVVHYFICLCKKVSSPLNFPFLPLSPVLKDPIHIQIWCTPKEQQSYE